MVTHFAEGVRGKLPVILPCESFFFFLYLSLIVAPGQNQKHKWSSIRCVWYPDNGGVRWLYTAGSSSRPRIVSFSRSVMMMIKEKVILLSEYTYLLSTNSWEFSWKFCYISTNMSQRAFRLTLNGYCGLWTGSLVEVERRDREEKKRRDPTPIPFSPRPLHSQLNWPLQPQPVYRLPLVSYRWL